MHSERQFEIERHLPRRSLEAVTFSEPEIPVEVDDRVFRYVAKDSLLSPDYAVLYSSETNNQPIRVDRGLLSQFQDYVSEQRATQEKYEKRGVPREQTRLRLGAQELLISNYGDRALSADIDELARWFSVVTGVTNEKFDHIRNILIEPADTDKLATGELANGVYSTELGSIRLFPHGFLPQQHRTGVTSNLTGTATHEYFHQYMRQEGATDLQRAWMELGGWRHHFRFPNNIQGRGLFSDFEQFIETDYGRESPAEEFCDAAVKSIYGRKTFKDVKKRAFLDTFFLHIERSVKAEHPAILPVTHPEVPKFPKEFTFTLVRLVEK